MRETLYDFCIRTGQQTLLQEWDAKRNAPLTPKDLSYGSKKKVWWRCAHGHVWQAMVTIRTANHSGCPYCSHQRPWPGENDLKTLYLHIAAEWHSERNGDLRPEHVLPGSRKKGVVDLRARTCLVRKYRFTDGREAMRLPGLCREGKGTKTSLSCENDRRT